MQDNINYKEQCEKQLAEIIKLIDEIKTNLNDQKQDLINQMKGQM